MENSNKYKSMFFAHYWGQRVWRYIHTNGEEALLYIDKETLYNKFSLGGGGYLELTNLKNISDEDAIEVAKIIAPEMYQLHKTAKFLVDRSEDDWLSVTTKLNIYSVDIDYSGYITKCIDSLDEYKLNPNEVHGIDYLRSKGYALPFMGVSVQQQIEWGWVELKSSS